ncbi:MAG: mandelate racemase/muconate lactonizing enzyme family protein [Candidatus Rokuibacteriota bacterium]
MKITRVVTHRLSIPLARPLKTSIHDIRALDTVVVEMRTDAGAVGAGYCFAFGPHRARAMAAMVDDLAPLYEGQDPLAARSRYDAAWRSLNFVGHAGIGVIALAPLDTACWDLAAQAAGVPLARLLGGTRTRVPAYASAGLWLDRTTDELLREAEAFVKQGHRAMKMRLGRTAAEDLERARALRKALGPDVKLLADVNQGWDEATAIRMGRALEEVNLFWLEEPLPYDDLAGAARVAAALDTPIASGETEYAPGGMQRYLDARAADILMPDLQRMGGVTGYLKAATLCEVAHTPLSSHLFMEASVHVLAAAPNALIMEHMDWWQELFDAPLALADGQVTLPEKPGVGVALNPKALERFKA